MGVSHVRDVKFAVKFEKLCGMKNNKPLFLLSNFLFRTPYYSFTPLLPLSVNSYPYAQFYIFLSSAGLEPLTPELPVKRLNR